MEKTRTIILHYHLFKNAGTSIDSVLKKNFGEHWISREFTGINNTPDVTQWIIDNPQGVAFSSHTMNGPIPKINGINIISLAMLRDPIKRIISAYKFERMQNSNSWGAQLARQMSFEDYVVTRLQQNGDTQCRNFQTSRLATLRPSKEPRVERAIAALNELSIVGIVEDFDQSMNRIANRILEDFPNFEYETAHSNKSKLFDFDLSPALHQLLKECNKDDIILWEHCRKHNQSHTALNA